MSLEEKQNLYQYELRGPDGRPIAGMLTEYDDVYKPGDHIGVIVDRRQQLDPKQRTSWTENG